MFPTNGALSIKVPRQRKQDADMEKSNRWKVVRDRASEVFRGQIRSLAFIKV